MKKILLILLLIMLVCTCQIQFVTALEIKLSKPDYLQGETFLAEIQAGFMEPLKVQNIFFKQDSKEISLAFYLLKISKQHYYVWVNLPEEIGEYSFGIENILYKEDGKLTGKTKEADFSINPAITPAYEDLIQDIKNKWHELDIETHALALIALAWHNQLASQGLTELNEKSKNQEEECWLSSSESCSVKETALALLASAELEEIENLKTSWLEDAQNNLNTGLWDLSINSNIAQLCQLKINNDIEELNLSQGTNTITLDLKDKSEEVTLKTNCSASSAKIIHTYLGKINEFPMQKQQNEYELVLNNKKCYGQSYRSNCNIEASAYASLALNKLELGNNGLISWLKANAETTKHKAIILYLSSSTTIKEWLINNQHKDGYWSSSALLESEEPDFEATIFATLALEKRISTTEAEKGKFWLKEQLQTANTQSKASALAFIFNSEQIEPIATFQPAAIKTTTNKTINIDIRNKGVSELNIIASLKPFTLEKTLTIQEADSETLSFDIPNKIGGQKIEENINGSLELDCETSISDKKSSYSIPVIILPGREVDPEDIEVANETGEEETKILPGHLRAAPTRIDAILLTKETNLIGILLKNLAPRKIGNISISYTRSLKKILGIEPSKIQGIEADESMLINLTIQHNKVEEFSGEIIINSASQNLTIKLPVTILFTENGSLVEMPKIPATDEEITKNKTCRDFNGTLCKEDELCKDGVIIKTEKTGRCCVGKCIKKTNKAAKIIGITMIIITIAIIATFLFLKLKKPKKQTKDIYSEIEKKYSKFKGKIEPKG